MEDSKLLNERNLTATQPHTFYRQLRVKDCGRSLNSKNVAQWSSVNQHSSHYLDKSENILFNTEKKLVHSSDTCRGICTVHVAGSDERPLDIVIIPPTGRGAVSDEDTVDEDNLSPSALPAEVASPLVIHFHWNKIPYEPNRKTSKETG